MTLSIDLLVWSQVAQAQYGVWPYREFKRHVHGKRQTSDSSWEFLKIENSFFLLKIVWNY